MSSHQSTQLMSQGTLPPATPSSRRIRDMLGEVTTNDLGLILEEIVHLLKDLPPGGFDKAYSQPTTATAPKAVSFMCNKQQFKDIVRLAELGVGLAEQSINAPAAPRAPPPDPLIATIVAGLKSLETKVVQLSLETANLAANQKSKDKTFADVAAHAATSAQHRDPKRPPGGKVKKPTAPLPSRAPYLTLVQSVPNRTEYVELQTDAQDLTKKASAAIIDALPEGLSSTTSTAPVRGITRNTYTGEIQLQLGDQALLKAILGLPTDDWVRAINPTLRLKRKLYPVIVHGIPTTFDPSNRRHTHALIDENHGVLDSSTRMIWANKFSIQSGKPFSSIIIYLSDPAAANQAIRNRVCFKHLLKITEKSTKRIRQCYQCLDFGHFAKKCPVDFRACSHCAGSHAYDACKKLAEPICCVNCAQKFLEAAYPGTDSVPITRLTPEQRRSCIHSPFSNSCPIRRAQTAQMASISDYYDVVSNE